MTIMQNFIIPLIKTLFYMIIFCSLGFVVFRAIFKSWTRYWKFYIRYKIKRVEYKDEDLVWIVESGKTKNRTDIQVTLLTAGKSNDMINRILFIYDDINKQSGGRLQDGKRQNEGDHRKAEKTALPDIPTESGSQK